MHWSPAACGEVACLEDQEHALPLLAIPGVQLVDSLGSALLNVRIRVAPSREASANALQQPLNARETP